MLEVTAVSAFQDNYIWLIHGPDRRVVIVDPGDAAPVHVALAAQQLEPAAIFVTHRHHDHIGGVAELAARHGVPVFGPAREAQEVVTEPCLDGNRVRPPGLDLEFGVLEIPGHTLGHIAFHGHGALFCGDTLFSAGCGRLFEGSPEQMSASLARLAALPAETRICCGHEYTLSNLRFAAAVEPDNAAIAAYREKAAALRAENRPTLPSQMARELEVNPFLRTSEAGIRRAAEQWSGTRLDDKVRVFAALRRWKDEF